MIVVGGGFAGVAAAIEAARKGLQVLLVEKYNCLGGAAMNCLVMPFMPYWTIDPETGKQTILTGDIFTQIITELEKLGADQVVIPESESGARMAKNLVSSGFVDIIELSGSVSMVELDVRPEWVGKSLLDLNLRKKYSMNVVAIRRGKGVSTDIDPNEPLAEDMELIVIASTAKLGKLK